MRLLNTNTRYLHENVVRYAERLTALLPDHLEVCFFVNSGSEANELALRLARAATGRPDVATVDVAYHGNTQRLVEISPYKFDGPGGAGPDDVQVVPLPDPYRGAHRGPARDRCGLRGGRREVLPRPTRAIRPGRYRRGDPRAWWPGRAAGRLACRPVRRRACGRGRADRRRGAGRLRARRRAFLGLRDAGRRARHRDDGQADRQRPSAGGRRHDPGDRRRLRQRDGVLQHVRRKPRLLRRSASPSSTSSATRACRSTPAPSGSGSRRTPRRSPRVIRRSATCAGRACSSGSSWSAIGRPEPDAAPAELVEPLPSAASCSAPTGRSTT